jgi:sugar lactone lactonase YvrE
VRSRRSRYQSVAVFGGGVQRALAGGFLDQLAQEGPGGDDGGAVAARQSQLPSSGLATTLMAGHSNSFMNHTRCHLASAVIAMAGVALTPRAATRTVSTILGTGVPGYSSTQVNNPYGIIFGPDGALYFCDLDNQRIRRFDLTMKTVTTIAGSGEKGYKGDGGPATQAALNMPHEVQFDKAGNLYIAERDNHVVRRVAAKTGIMSTVAGTGVAGFSGDGGPGVQAQLRQPHSIVFDRDGTLLICDIGNQRIRRLHLDTGIIETYAGTGEAAETPDGAPVSGTPLRGPRTMVMTPTGDLYLALREGNAILRIDARTQTLHRIAGTGKQGYAGDGGPAMNATLGGPKGLAYAPGELFVADTENHAVRRVDLTTGVITTVLGTGVRGDGPETSPLDCKLSRPHGVLADASGTVYVTDSEAHRIRVMK